MAVLFASPYFTALDSSGTPISGAKAKFFLAGTTTPQEVWADRALTTTRGATVTADSAGRFPDIWVPETISYRVQILDASDVLLEDVDYAIQATATTAATTTAGAEVKNILVNGGMDVWSLGTSFSNVGGSATLSETADEWFVSQVGTAGNSVTRQTGTSGASRYGLRLGRPAANTTTGQLRLLQGIETGLVYRFAGKQVTVSFWAYQGANFSGTNLSITLATGTAEGEALTGVPTGTWTGQVNAISQVQGLTTTATRYQFTATLAANIKEIGLMLAYTPSGTAGANDWVQIENVQIEGAGQATEFAARQTSLDFINARVAQPPTAANFATAFGLGTGDSPQFAALNIGNASDTTITRVSAGVIAVEGATVYTSGNLPGTAITWTALQTFGAGATVTAPADLGGLTVNGSRNNIGVSIQNGQSGAQAAWNIFSTATGSGFGAGLLTISRGVSAPALTINGSDVVSFLARPTFAGNTPYDSGNLPGTSINWTAQQTFQASVNTFGTGSGQARQDLNCGTSAGHWFYKSAALRWTVGYAIAAGSGDDYEWYNAGTGATTLRLRYANNELLYGQDVAPTDVRAIGYLGTNPVSRGGNYTLALSDSGRRQNVTATLTCTIPLNATVAFPIGTVIPFRVGSGATLTVSPTGGVTLTRMDGSGSTGARTCTAFLNPYIEKTGTDAWDAVGFTG